MSSLAAWPGLRVAWQPFRWINRASEGVALKGRPIEISCPIKRKVGSGFGPVQSPSEVVNYLECLGLRRFSYANCQHKHHRQRQPGDCRSLLGPENPNPVSPRARHELFSVSKRSLPVDYRPLLNLGVKLPGKLCVRVPRLCARSWCKSNRFFPHILLRIPNWEDYCAS